MCRACRAYAGAGWTRVFGRGPPKIVVPARAASTSAPSRYPVGKPWSSWWNLVAACISSGATSSSRCFSNARPKPPLGGLGRRTAPGTGSGVGAGSRAGPERDERSDRHERLGGDGRGCRRLSRRWRRVEGHGWLVASLRCGGRRRGRRRRARAAEAVRPQWARPARALHAAGLDPHLLGVRQAAGAHGDRRDAGVEGAEEARATVADHLAVGAQQRLAEVRGGRVLLHEVPEVGVR